MRHGSLESGLGGFDYAAQMIGWENIFHCEINTFCQQILKYYWPNAKSFTDIFEFDGKPWRGKVDIITAGFPCQPFSHAGKRKGTEDDRHIWPENMRIFREAKPRFILAENVPGLLTIESGMVFETVCADLENEGYEVQAFIIPACAKDAVHRRDRVWIVAHVKCNTERPTGNCFTNGSGRQAYVHTPGQSRNGQTVQHNRCDSLQSGNDTNTTSQGLEGKMRQKQQGNRGRFTTQNRGQFNIRNENWLEAATRLCSVDDEFAGRFDTDSISKVKWRTESLKAYGNAIYWPIAYEIFKAIEETERIMSRPP